MASMNDILVNSNGFTGISDEDRYDECQIGIAEVLRDIKKVARNWKVWTLIIVCWISVEMIRHRLFCQRGNITLP